MIMLSKKKGHKDNILKEVWADKLKEFEEAQSFLNECDQDAFEIANARFNLIQSELSFICKKMKELNVELEGV